MPAGGVSGGQQYEGSDISTGSQTPEGVTSPDTIEGSGEMETGTDNGGEATDNGNAGS